MILVVGPPCGGKTTWVREQALPADTILDYDDITEELGATRYQANDIIKARAAEEWGRRLPSAQWVIWANPTRRQRARLRRQYNAQVVRVMASQATCLERAAADRPASWQHAIRQWFTTYEPSTTTPEMVINTEQNAETGR